MSDRCRICKRVHYGFLDVCGPCIAENEGLVQHSPKKVVVPLKQSIPETKKSLKQTKNETLKVQYIPPQPSGSLKIREDMIDKEATKRFLAGEDLATVLETNNSLKQNNNETKKRGRPREGRTICRSCKEPLAKGSNSYCRLHERERLKKWRSGVNKSTL